MKKSVFRVLAFVLDSLLVSLIIYGISLVSVFNPNKKEINIIYDSAEATVDEYTSFMDKFDEYFKDEKISEEEMVSLKDEFETYGKSLDIEKITSENVVNEAQDIYSNYIKDLKYKLSKLTRIQDIAMTIISLLYFGVIQFLLKGQTLFKKIFRIKVVNKDESDVSIWKLIGRSLIVNELIFVAVSVGISYISSINTWGIASSIVGNLKYFVELLLIFVLIVREDGKSIHDLLFGTKIVMIDKDNNIITEDVVNNTSEELPEAEVIEEKVVKKSVKKVTKKNVKKVDNKDN